MLFITIECAQWEHDASFVERCFFPASLFGNLLKISFRGNKHQLDCPGQHFDHFHFLKTQFAFLKLFYERFLPRLPLVLPDLHTFQVLMLILFMLYLLLLIHLFICLPYNCGLFCISIIILNNFDSLGFNDYWRIEWNFLAVLVWYKWFNWW